MNHYRKYLKVMNNVIYIIAAAMLMAGLVLTVTPGTVTAGNGNGGGGGQDTCPNGGDWVKIELPGNSTTFTYDAPAGKEIVEICYKAGSDQSGGGTYSFSVTPPATSVLVTNDQLQHENGQFLGLSHVSARMQTIPTPTDPTPTDPTPTDPTPTDPTPTDPTPTDPTPTDPVVDPLLLLDPYCVEVRGAWWMQWLVENPNDFEMAVDSWKVDGVTQPAGFNVQPGDLEFLQTALGTHTVELFWGKDGSTSLEWRINSCTKTQETPTPVPTLPPPSVTFDPLGIPVTGASVPLLIPVTGVEDLPGTNGLVFAGMGVFGIGLVMTGLRKRLED